MVDERQLLAQTELYLQASVFPYAISIDNDPTALQTALMGLAELGLLALRVPQVWGGAQVSEECFYAFFELVARYSGALAFLQSQHQSAARLLVHSQNDSLKRQYLPHLSNGQVLVGVGFSQLRRQGESLIVAAPVVGGYQLDGKVPWVTGLGLLHKLIVAASLPDGQAVFGLVPFVETHQESGGAIVFSQPMPLAAMTSTNTVSATLTNWFLPQEHVVCIQPAGWIHENDKKNVLQPTSLALGCARAGLDLLQATYSLKRLSFIARAFKTLDCELCTCRARIKEAQAHGKLSLDKRLQLRAWSIDLAVRCAHAAVTVSSGAANFKHHAAQRIYREALVFTVSGQTTAVMEATLTQLIRVEFEPVITNNPDSNLPPD